MRVRLFVERRHINPNTPSIIRLARSLPGHMASFGWKRKAGEKVSRSAAQHFEGADDNHAAAAVSRRDGEVDWQQAVKRRRDILLEECAAKSKTLKDQGVLLAEQNRHRDAVKKWDEAIQLTPDDPLLYEMKAQVLTALREAFPAVKAAETAVKLRRVWWEAWQTLGRAQLTMGEVDLALRSFQVAVHLRPWEPALWQEDLAWARTLRRRKAAAGETLVRRAESDRRLADPPELGGDFDFESDEVVAACEAVARRQAGRPLSPGALVVDAAGNVLESGADAAGDAAAEPLREDFVKMRRL
ncbi:tetratricopeptide repeat protein 33 isoform X2 [Syngnathus typhle]|uniref:tetratricopeptide repeat protein 33 isoform X2 n=1 Tax=Syngnathus typhle TaxID=161592 RepID=UPI002A6AA605|nr:tetratricopeptide repeat protein 33 isoform X2 [Syngnathus typhle]